MFVFSHGQLYVAFFRATASNEIVVICSINNVDFKTKKNCIIQGFIGYKVGGFCKATWVCMFLYSITHDNI